MGREKREGYGRGQIEVKRLEYMESENWEERNGKGTVKREKEECEENLAGKETIL